MFSVFTPPTPTEFTTFFLINPFNWRNISKYRSWKIQTCRNFNQKDSWGSSIFEGNVVWLEGPSNLQNFLSCISKISDFLKILFILFAFGPGFIPLNLCFQIIQTGKIDLGLFCLNWIHRWVWFLPFNFSLNCLILGNFIDDWFWLPYNWRMQIGVIMKRVDEFKSPPPSFVCDRVGLISSLLFLDLIFLPFLFYFIYLWFVVWEFQRWLS